MYLFCISELKAQRRNALRTRHQASSETKKDDDHPSDTDTDVTLEAKTE